MRDLSYNEKQKSPVLKIVLITFCLLFIFVAAVYFLNVDKYVFKGPQTVVQLITDSGLKKDNGRTNVLLLGIGGGSHDGPDLTDTIMIASIDDDKKNVTLVSIPRDLWVPSENTKINHVYAYGQEKNQEGLEKSQEIISNLLGIPIHYAFRIDFNGFTEAVDLVGGLSVEVDTSFTDPKYPITGKEDDLCDLKIETEQRDGVEVKVVKDATGSAILLTDIDEKNDPFLCRYETLTFTKGLKQMDGTTALKFVRSRHGTNGEGSDFARSARQQKVILAFREKMLSQETLTNPKKILELLSTFGDSIDTNIGGDEVPLFAKMIPNINTENIKRVVLDATRPESVLEFGLPQNYFGQSVVVPKGNNWEELKTYLQNQIFPPQDLQSDQKGDSTENLN